MIMFGRSTGLPAARMRSRQRHFNAIPASIAASLEPVVDVPVATLLSDAYNDRRRSLIGEAASFELRPGRIDGYGGEVPVRARSTTPASRMPAPTAASASRPRAGMTPR